MELLKGYSTPKRIRFALGKLPEKLGAAYDDIMERIDRQAGDQRTMALTALMWITYARKRFTVDELLHLIALGLDPDITDIENDDLTDIDLLLSSCAGLVTLNHEDRIIRLVHYTTQDYLESRFPGVDVNTFLAKSCLTYLGFDAFSDPPVDNGVFEHLMKQYPLSRYAASYWGDHTRQGREADLEQTILSTLGTQEKRDTIEWFESTSRGYRHYGSPFQLANQSLFHLASKHGLSHMCSMLLSHSDTILSDST